eukprot:TRINITY_DN12242_c0_g1_i1.p1 TRINITY_DN12242_c0_g1~~TRINITY_DN12242_c0_g1_i1.p1  ORF type:complete len:237 (-),score=31.49 TRINITY_DN12242_c0_g1_i1:84-731(-)
MKEYECPICCCDYKIQEMYTLDNCFHRYCFECLGEFLKVKIMESETDKLFCPDPQCKCEISRDEVRHCVSPELFAKFDEFTLKSALNNMEDLRWCPKAGCGNAMIGDEANPMMVCSNTTCRYTFCFKCKEEWHTDATCEEYATWKVENSEAEQRYQEWMKQHAKICPKCQAPIEKNGGCNHMTCKNCNYEFCWLCNAIYTSDHWDKKPTNCKQFS